MAVQRMDNVSIVVEDLEAAVAFFVELGLELEGRATVEGPAVDRTGGLEGVRSEIAMVRTPDGHSRLELTRFERPAAVSGGSCTKRSSGRIAPQNTSRTAAMPIE